MAPSRGKRVVATAFSLSLLAIAALLALATSAEASSPRRRRSHKAAREWRGRKRACEQAICDALHPFERSNCVNKCISPSCFRAVYGERPLEDGEVNPELYDAFVRCAVRLGTTLRRNHSLWPPIDECVTEGERKARDSLWPIG